MSTDVGAIRTYFMKLGLEQEVADIYLALHTYGPQSISQLSRNAHIERTRIYRLIDHLMDSNLIEVEPQQKRGIIKAAPIANLHILIAQKEQELHSLQDELGLIEQVLARNSLSSPVARVQFYEGRETAKQVRQNMLSAKSEVCSILLKRLDEEIDPQFANQWVEAVDRQRIKFRTIFDQKPQQTAATHIAPSSWDERYMASGQFPITYSTMIYDDTVAMFEWQNKNIFGIELHSSNVAGVQKAFFELLWQQSQL